MLLLSACFLVASVLFAGPVTKEQAQQIASQFLMGKGVNHRALSAEQLKAEVVLNAVDKSGQPYLYAVTQGEEDGFVIVSGDDRFREVLGYSNSGTFDSTQMPDNMRAWLQGYVDEMKHLKAIGYQPTVSASRRASGVKAAIAPLVQTTWNQGDPYNQKCPDFFTYGKCVTGCVATAMAQVVYYASMKAGKQPAQTLVATEAYQCERNWSGLGKISVDAIPVTTLDWDNMLADYKTGSPTTEQQTAVATLMQICGASVQMDYANSDNGGSGAYTSNVAPALIKYFDYDQTTRFISRSNYDLSSWTELMYDELAAERPVLYGGQSSGGGHAFVVDGYDGDEMFHVNWGWGGSCDNYFALSVMNPNDNSGIGASTSNDGYSYDQDAVIGIQIGSGETVEPTPVTIGIYSFVIDGTSVKLSAFNWTGSTNTFDVGIGTVDGAGDLSLLHTFQTNCILEENQGQHNMTYTFVKDETKANTSIKVVPISKLSSETKWATTYNTALKYILVEYDAEGNPTLTEYPLASNLSVTAWNFAGTKYKDEVQPVEVTISNTGGEFYGVLYLFASTSESKGSAVNKGGVTVQKNKSASLTFEWTPDAAATYNLWVATDESASNVIGQTTVAIEVNSHAPDGPFIISSLTVADEDTKARTVDGDGNIQIDVYSKTIEVAPVVKNISSTNYSGVQPYFYLEKWDGSTWSSVATLQSSSSHTLKAGETLSFSTMTYGTNYDYGKYRIKMIVGSHPDDSRYVLNLVRGYNAIDNEGNVVKVKVESDDITVSDNVAAVDLTGLDFTGVAPNSNPNTLYIISSSQTAPATLSGKNVVQNGAIDNLGLTDGYAFSTPVDFTAKKISYTRTFDKFYDDGKGWTTVVLPFAASTVVNNAGNLPWDEANRKFWLMEFSGEDGSTVYFVTASTPLKANTPYIIAIPGSNYGSYSLDGDGKNTLTFSADDVTVKAGAKAAVTVSNYKFVGTMTNTGSLDNIYALNNDGDTFKKGTATVEPFRAYFAATSTAATATSLGISFGNSGTTGIEELKPSAIDLKREGVYNLNGQRVAKPTKGLYIVNGKKVIIK